MNSSKLAITIFLFICAFACKPSEPTTSTTALVGATVFDGNGNQIDNATIVIEDGIILEVGTSETVAIPDGAETIDVKGKFITPGLIDAHVHFFQTAFFDSRPDAGDLRDSLPYQETMDYQRDHPERYYEAYLRSGITGVYDVGGFPWSIGLQESAENNLDAPHVAASGILLTPAPQERLSTFNTDTDSTLVHLGSEDVGRTITAQNSQMGATGQKVWQMIPGDSTFLKNINAVKEEIENQGNKMIVHATTLAQAKLAIELGAKLLVHSVQDQAVDVEFIEMIQKSPAIYSPTLIVARGYFNTFKALNGEGFVIQDPNNAVDSKTKGLLKGAVNFKKFLDEEWLQNRISASPRRLGKNDSIMAINLKKLYNAGVTIVVATDAGNPGTVHGISIYDEMEAMQNAGIPARDIIPMATRNGAIAMERINDFGTLEAGKMADLIVLDSSPAEDISNMRSITHVMRGGKIRPVNKPFY